MTRTQEIVRSLYAAFAAGDVPAFLARLHPEIRWNEAEGFPYSDRNPYVGPQAILAGVFARLQADWDGFQVVVEELAGEGDVVTMFGRYKARHRKSGKPLDAQVAHTWWLRGDQVVRFQQMVDTAHVERART